jgi:RNA polymerase sigma factor (sigma-70 family)
MGLLQVEAVAADEGEEPEQRRDERLVAQVLAGDEGAFEALYERYFRRITRFVLRRLDAVSDVEDVVQEVFLAVFLSAHSFRGESGLDGWIFGVARNVLRSTQRRRWAHKRFAPLLPHEPLEHELPCGRLSPEERAEGLSFLQAFESQARRALGDEEWELLRDYHLDEVSIDDLGRRRSASREALKSRLYRARRRLFASTSALTGADGAV